MQLQEQRLQELSEIEVKYFVGSLDRDPYVNILVVKYRGGYRYGSEGNPDARLMCAMAKAGVEAFQPCSVVHDMSDLSYDWGDMLDLPLGVGPDIEGYPIAYVVGPACGEAVRTLFLGLASEQPIESIGNVFWDLESAWAYIDNQLAARDRGA